MVPRFSNQFRNVTIARLLLHAQNGRTPLVFFLRPRACDMRAEKPKGHASRCQPFPGGQVKHLSRYSRWQRNLSDLRAMSGLGRFTYRQGE
jgi:hypothetical protein